MSCVGQQNPQMPPRPSSSHSQGMPMPNQQPGNQQQQQNMNIPNSINPQMEGPPGPQGGMPPMQQGAYPGQNAPGQHMQPHGSYKLGPYPPQSSQYSQGNYSPRAQYPGYGNQHHPPPPNSPSQYRPMQNHVSPASHPQYPPHGPYHQVWPPPPQQNQANNPGAMSNHIQGKNIGPPPPQSPQQQQGPPQPPNQQQQQPPPQQQQQQQPGGSPRQLNYLKQHLQHKGGYQGTTPPPQGYNGPGIHPMGPPAGHHMGPPTGISTMGPPATTGTPPSSHMAQEGGMGGIPPPNIHHPEGMSVSQDNGMPSQTSHQATSLITTGPDGAALDEVSQQSTLSNTSIGEFSCDFLSLLY